MDAESTRSTSTGTPVSQDIPASASTSAGSLDISWFTFAPPQPFELSRGLCFARIDHHHASPAFHYVMHTVLDPRAVKKLP